MMRDPLAELTDALGRRPPEGLATLPRSVLAEVTQAVHDARVTQTEHLAVALDAALKIAPRPVRGLVRKLLVG